MAEIASDPTLNTHERYRFERWRDYVNEHFPALEMCPSNRQDFCSDVTYRRFGRMDFAYIDTSALTIERTVYLARRSEVGYIKVLWQLGGELEVEQGDRSCLLRRGDISICDTSRRYRLRASNGSRHAVLLLPHEIDHRLPAAAARRCATSLAEESAYHAALGAIIGLINQSHNGPLHDINAVIETVGNMLAQTLINNREDHRHEAGRLGAAQRYIENHISATELTPDHLARGLNLSRRSLYNSLAQHGTTPARMISELRLNHARALLEKARAGDRLIDIAYASGFRDSAHFSRAFKQRFGESPSHWRARCN